MRGNFIGIMANESAALLKGLLGILKSGNGFVPINPAFPKERIDFIINDCNIKVLLTDRTNEDKAAQVVRDNPRVEQLICIDHPGEIEMTDSRWQKKCSVIPGDQPCYLIYTSGSTGKPKGVPITHTNLTPLFLWFRDYFLLGEHTKILQTLSYTFDFGIFELLTTLIFGGTIYFLNREEVYDLNDYVDFIAKHGINTIHATPSFFSSIVSVGRKMPTLKLVHLGGEKLTVKMVEDISQLLEGDYRIYNGYGPTEATINVSIFAVTPEPEVKQYIKKIDTVPIGKPSANNVIYILDKRNRLLPVGIPGEICIGGGGVARGYLNRPELTAEKFNRSYKSYRTYISYKTGDLGRWLPDGNIQYIGRIDDQVKVRGFRIELGEIENCLLNHEKIKDTAVVVREDRQGDKYLCAYYVPAVSAGDIDGAVLREYLAERLPDYMVPSFFVQMEKMPLSSSGKINRKALPEPMVTGDMGYVEPQNELEERLQKIWQEIFEQEPVGIYDDFFEIGGHSLKAIQLIGIIHRECSVKIPLDVLFKSPTIKELADYIQGAAKETFLSIPLVEEKEYYPLSSAQERLYVLQQMELDGIAYNIPQFYILDGRLDSGKLEQAFQGLIKRHESLRTSFQMINQKPVQRIHPEVEFSIEYYEKDEIHHFVRPFDLSLAPLLGAGLIKTGDSEHLLLVDLHHIITDGTSMDLFISDLMAIYAGKELPALKLRYKDYSEWQNSEQQIQSEELRQQEAFWLKQFEGEVPVLHLPTDYIRPAVQSFEGGILNFQLAVEHSEALNKLALDTGTTLYMVVLAIYYIFLSRLSGQEDIVVGTPVEARRSVELERIIGMFVNMLPMRNYPGSNKSFKGFLKELKNDILEAFENQDYPFEDLVERLSIKRDVSRNPLFDVTFTLAKLEGMAGGAIEVPQLSVKPYETEDVTHISKFDLSLICLDRGEGQGFYCIFEYCTRLFKKETIQGFVSYLEKIVVSVIENPGVVLSEIEIMPGEDRQEILNRANRTVPEPVKEEEAVKDIILPGNELEKKLAALWSDVLCIDENVIGVDSDFFQLGGHSLKATVLVSEINREFMSRMPLVQMFTTPTIRQLAAYLMETEEETAHVAENQMVRLKKGSSGRHLFLVHDGSGEVEGYIELCSRLAVDIDCWGIRAQRFAGYAPHNFSIEEIAGTYIEKIKKVQSHGPYHIAGWSLGGTIAYEMVRQLEENGEAVGYLLLIDSPPPQKNTGDTVFEFNRQSEVTWLSRYLADEAVKEKIEKQPDIEAIWSFTLDYLEGNDFDREVIRKAIPGNLVKVIPNVEQLSIRQLVMYLNVIRSLDKARDGYLPPTKIKTPAHYVGAGQSTWVKKEEWNQYTEAPVRFYQIRGDHFSILRMPQLKGFARVFKNLEAVEED